MKAMTMMRRAPRTMFSRNPIRAVCLDAAITSPNTMFMMEMLLMSPTPTMTPIRVPALFPAPPMMTMSHGQKV